MSYTNLLYHIVFGTKGRAPLILPTFRPRLHEYLGGIVKGLNCVPIEINGVADHVHLLVRLQPVISVSDFLAKLKSNSSGWTRRNHSRQFRWQVRYAAFSVSESQVPTVRRYIRNQEQHHRKMSFEDELKALLRAHRIEFDEKYLWG